MTPTLSAIWTNVSSPDATSWAASSRCGVQSKSAIFQEGSRSSILVLEHDLGHALPGRHVGHGQEVRGPLEALGLDGVLRIGRVEERLLGLGDGLPVGDGDGPGAEQLLVGLGGVGRDVQLDAEGVEAVVLADRAPDAGLDLDDNGGFFAWDGAPIPW